MSYDKKAAEAYDRLAEPRELDDYEKEIAANLAAGLIPTRILKNGKMVPDPQVVFAPTEVATPDQTSSRDILTFRFHLPCHRDQEAIFEVPFVTFDDGSSTYEMVEATSICLTCKREFLFTNVDEIGRIILDFSDVPHETQFDDLRDVIRDSLKGRGPN